MLHGVSKRAIGATFGIVFLNAAICIQLVTGLSEYALAALIAAPSAFAIGEFWYRDSRELHTRLMAEYNHETEMMALERQRQARMRQVDHIITVSNDHIDAWTAAMDARASEFQNMEATQLRNEGNGLTNETEPVFARNLRAV